MMAHYGIIAFGSISTLTWRLAPSYATVSIFLMDVPSDHVMVGVKSWQPLDIVSVVSWSRESLIVVELELAELG